jgi:heat-inducible transcriptional repressor
MDTSFAQEELRFVSAVINEQCNDATVEGVGALLNRSTEAHTPHLEELRRHVLELIARSMRQLEDSVNRQIYSDGLMEMLSQPEFIPSLLKEEDADRAIERMRQVLQTLTSSSALGSLIVQALASDGVQVIIGEEHGKDEMRDYSVVLSRYGVSGVVVGVLGIIGPTRMAYPRSISTVRYMSSVLSDLLCELYGADAASSNTDT